MVLTEYEPLKDIIDKAIGSNIGISNMLEIVANMSDTQYFVEYFILYNNIRNDIILWTKV